MTGSRGREGSDGGFAKGSAGRVVLAGGIALLASACGPADPAGGRKPRAPTPAGEDGARSGDERPPQGRDAPGSGDASGRTEEGRAADAGGDAAARAPSAPPESASPQDAAAPAGDARPGDDARRDDARSGDGRPGDEARPGDAARPSDAAPAPASPQADRGVVILYQHQSKSGHLFPRIVLRSTARAPLPLDEVRIRYWFGWDHPKDGFESCDCVFVSSAVPGLTCAGVKLAVGKTPVPRPLADRAVDLTFQPGFALAAGGSVDVKYICRTFAGSYDEANDYSADRTRTAPALWDRIAVYDGATLVWGVEP